MKICAETDLLGTIEIKFHVAVPEGWPLPAWRGWGFVTPSSSAVQFLDMSEHSLKSVLRSLCPTPNYLDFVEIKEFLAELQARLSEQLSPVEEIFDLPQESFIVKLLPWLGTAPREFWQWCDERSVSWGQLRALGLLDPAEAPNWLRDIARLGASSQLGHKILESCVELELMGTPSDQLAATPGENITSWERRLRELRFPLSEKMLREGARKVENIFWPKGVAAKWSRQGDRQVLEIRLTASSQHEYTRQLERLLKDDRSPWT